MKSTTKRKEKLDKCRDPEMIHWGKWAYMGGTSTALRLADAGGEEVAMLPEDSVAGTDSGRSPPQRGGNTDQWARPWSVRGLAVSDDQQALDTTRQDATTSMLMLCHVAEKGGRPFLM